MLAGWPAKLSTPPNDSAKVKTSKLSTEQDLEDILRAFKIDVRIIGEEYKDKDFTGKAYCEAKGIEMYYNNRDHRFSSSGLKKQVQYANLKKKDT